MKRKFCTLLLWSALILLFSLSFGYFSHLTLLRNMVLANITNFNTLSSRTQLARDGYVIQAGQFKSFLRDFSKWSWQKRWSAQMEKNPPAMQETWVWSLVRKIPWRRKRLPAPVFLPGEFRRQRNLAGYSPWGHKESDTTERLILWHTSIKYLLVHPLSNPPKFFSHVYSKISWKCFYSSIFLFVLNSVQSEFSLVILINIIYNPHVTCLICNTWQSQSSFLHFPSLGFQDVTLFRLSSDLFCSKSSVSGLSSSSSPRPCKWFSSKIFRPWTTSLSHSHFC